MYYFCQNYLNFLIKMKKNTTKIVRFFVFLSIFFTALSSHSQSKNLKYAELPRFFYKKMEGKLANDSTVIIDLIKVDSTFKGRYYYKLIGHPVDFSGLIRQDGSIKLEEEGEETGEINEPFTVFHGSFASPETFKGTWERLNDDSIYRFELKENYEKQHAEFEIVQRYEGYGTCEYGFCADFELSYPILKNKDFAKKINEDIQKTLLTEKFDGKKLKFKNFDDMIKDFLDRYKKMEKEWEAGKKTNPKPLWENHHEVKIMFNDYDLLSLDFLSTIYEGGAHPTTSIIFHNFDLKKGKKIELNDLFNKGYEKQLNPIAEKIFRTRYGFGDKDLASEGFMFKNNKFTLNENFTFSKQGITFQFNTEEIAAHTFGSPKIFIPFSQIKNLVKKGSILEKLL